MGSSFLIICSIHLICSSLILNVNDLRDLCHCQSKRRSSQTHTKVQLESGTESLCFLWLAPSFLPTWALRLLSGDLEARTRFALRPLTEERHHVSFLIFDFCRSEVWNGSHWAKIKVLTWLHSSLEGLRQNVFLPFPVSTKGLHWLVTPSHHQSQQWLL